MAKSPQTGGMHHITLTVTDVERSIDWYMTHLGFQVAARFEPHRAMLSNGAVMLAMGPAYYDEQATEGDRFSEFRVGLDHVSFAIDDLQALEEAAAYFDEQGIPRGVIEDLSEGFGIYVMPFRDPDNIQLEFTAPFTG